MVKERSTKILDLSQTLANACPHCLLRSGDLVTRELGYSHIHDSDTQPDTNSRAEYSNL